MFQIRADSARFPFLPLFIWHCFAAAACGSLSFHIILSLKQMAWLSVSKQQRGCDHLQCILY